MKRNLIPLLGVAFVVAIASTGIFYGLFVGKLKSAPAQSVVIAARPLRAGVMVAKADLTTMAWSGQQVPKGMFENTDRVVGHIVMQTVEEGEPVLESRLLSRAPGGGVGVPEGMRAVSVHVSDSAGVLTILRPGHKVDVQAFASRPGEHGPDQEARTVFQNVPVLAVAMQAEPSALGGFNAPVVTLLVSPREADTLGVADSFGRIRLALRNPLDEGKETKIALSPASVFRGQSNAPAVAATMPSVPAGHPVAAARPAQSGVALAVELLSVSAETAKEMARYGLQDHRDVLDATAVVNPASLRTFLDKLREQRAVDVLSSSHVNAGMSRTAAVELRALSKKTDQGGGLRVQFLPFIANGQLHMKVQPEVTVPSGVNVATRRLETELDISGGRSFFISGLTDVRAREWLLERWLGPLRADRPHRELLVLVTPTVL